MAIQKTYWDGNTEDRRYQIDLWSWMKNEPQDVRFLWIRQANWDEIEYILDRIVDDPNTDLAIISWQFFHEWAVINEGELKVSERAQRIVINLDKGFYIKSDLYLNPLLILSGAQNYVRILREGHKLPFRFPRELCGPFGNRRAICPVWSTGTQEELEELLDFFDGVFPQSEDEYMQWQKTGGNLWYAEAADLSEFNNIDRNRLAQSTDLEFLEVIFGESEAYDRKREKARVLANRLTGNDVISTKDRRYILSLLAFGIISIGGALVAHRLRTGGW